MGIGGLGGSELRRPEWMRHRQIASAGTPLAHQALTLPHTSPPPCSPRHFLVCVAATDVALRRPAVSDSPLPLCGYSPQAQGAPTAAPTTSELDRVRDRLHAICDGGLVLPLPFLRAAEAQPLALLGGWGAAAGAGGPQQQTSVWGTAAGAGAEDGAGGGCQLRQPPVPGERGPHLGHRL